MQKVEIHKHQLYYSIINLHRISQCCLFAGTAELMEEDGASLNPLFSSPAGSESSSAPLTLPDGFNWSPLARSRAQESLPTNGVNDNSHTLECARTSSL